MRYYCFILEDLIKLSYLVDRITEVEQSQNDAILEKDKVTKKIVIVVMVVAIADMFVAVVAAVVLMSCKNVMLITFSVLIVTFILVNIISFSVNSQH